MDGKMVYDEIVEAHQRGEEYEPEAKQAETDPEFRKKLRKLLHLELVNSICFAWHDNSEPTLLKRSGKIELARDLLDMPEAEFELFIEECYTDAQNAYEELVG